MTNLLSTKKLTQAQRAILEQASTELLEHDGIAIEFLDFQIDLPYDNYIFTSRNAVTAVLKKQESGEISELSKISTFCVGKKTERYLLENDVKVIKSAKNSQELAQFIAKNHENERFLFFCGNRRRQELPEILGQENVVFHEHVVYNTHLNPKNFKRNFDGILFYSPSGVQSFAKQNKFGKSMAFCIGNSTAKTAQQYTSRVVVSDKSTIEDVLKSAKEYFERQNLQEEGPN